MVLSQFTGIANQPLADDSSGHAHCRPINGMFPVNTCGLSILVHGCNGKYLWSLLSNQRYRKVLSLSERQPVGQLKLLNVTKTWALSPFCRTMCVSRRHGNISPSPERPDHKIRHPENIKTPETTLGIGKTKTKNIHTKTHTKKQFHLIFLPAIN